MSLTKRLSAQYWKKMGNMVKVSIIVPSLNVAAYMDEALSSVSQALSEIAYRLCMVR